MFPPVKLVFLSSVGRVLKKHRQMVSEAIGYLDGYKCVRMEDFGARDSSSKDFCCDNVHRCDVFVGILGPLYGSCPRRSRQSFSELEYEAAVEAGVPRLMFLTPESFCGTECAVESKWKQGKQRTFRKRVTNERQGRYFTSPMQLATEVVVALYNNERSQESQEQERSATPESYSGESVQEMPQPRKANPQSPNRRQPVMRPPLTTLFFPFVTNSMGWDTGIVITNPTAEPFSDNPQTGSCCIHFFGSTPGGPAPATEVTPPVPPGGQVLFTLSGGGNGISGAPGFQGYLVVECRFKNASGFAMVTAMGEPNRPGSCYLAEVIPNRKATGR